ncbi:MAG: NAD(P) transhydrogenase subunit alpha [Prevotella sp.]|jgi:NAD(P) transhydrogenase subunit alpha|uniref:NAD(P) transhydrogenase subunit alpha n=1 Tax=Prevotella sp. Rep29 TaxID=2691580 RepID=UPI001B72AC26|nr:NAD(P) transhydrogenase subunit alpha [Prevotella sp. Rep29]MBP3835321.1 NAD(P) transhydrogenase subunit alpha [Prevotella sp.]MBR1656448.1 NAD(P) transhydrogenase subunit alpha [Prevotella sp.]MBR3444458.1 NAD(P) transhydrogenase subunit alpha [Prevotella sp.]QYR10512.1 NAD(P)(+) transhydrogenase (Re/Si-specific) subunit alpha [Prevotella sp. Rep29]
MIIGIPKEIMHDEARVACTPETVEKFVKDGFEVLVEKSAGDGALFCDDEYIQAGAKVIDNPQEIYDKAEIILKVKEPLFNEKLGKHEVDMMHKGQYLITFIHPASPVNHEMVKNLSAKGVTAITLDGIPRISRAQNLDALTSMSTCAGYKGILMAANHLTRFLPQMFTAVGKIEPAKVMVIGVGVAGLQALATAKRLGAITYAADIRPMAAENAGSLGAKVTDTGVPAELAVGEGGYALRLPDDVLVVERENLKETIQEMDIVFCSALIPGKVAPIIITEEMVKGMKRGSVIVDISIDQGGNCELTPKGGIETKHGVTIMGVKNIPGELPTSSTWMFSNNMYNLVKYLVKDGKIELDRSDEVVAKSLVCIDGELVHAGAREAMGL